MTVLTGMSIKANIRQHFNIKNSKNISKKKSSKKMIVIIK